LHVERIDERPITVVMPVKHPLARKRTIGLDDLVRYPLITWQRDNPFRHWLEANFERAGVLERMQVVVETSYLETMEQCVSLGLGLGVGTFPRGRRPTVRVCLGLLAAMPSLPLVLLWKKGRLLTPQAALFIELVKQSLKRRRGKA
jgi:DNA-binding transcriptional LysR family regulator